MEEFKEENTHEDTLRRTRTYAKIITFSCMFVFLFAFFGVRAAPAATLYFSPASGSYEVGQSFSVNVYVSSSDQAMNAASGALSFSRENLEVVSLSKSSSIISLWVQEPSFSNSAGTINFEGIVLNPGFTGQSGKVATITFKAKAVGSASLVFSSGAVLANDGKGTNILASLGSGSYTVTGKTAVPEKTIETKTPEITKPTPKKEELLKEEKPSEVLEINKPQITSPTHPGQTVWYAANDVKFKWELPFGTTGVSILLNDKPASNPGPVSDGLFSSKDYQDLEDGIWYLHLKFKSQVGWTEIDHYKVQVDTTPPLPFKVTVDTKESAGWPVLYFKTADAVSGLDRYEVKLSSLNAKTFTVVAEDESFTVPPLPPAEHMAIVKAIDKAGNETLAFADFTIEPIETPVIKNYLEELKSSDQLFITGTALPDVTVNVFIQNEKTGAMMEKAVKSDKNGNWHFVYEEGLANGRYFAWVEAINSQGKKSKSSEKISFLVTSPIFVKIGSWAINYFTVFIILLLFTILVIALLAYWAGLIRGRLKKEADEVQKVLHSNLKEFRRLIEKESAYLESLEGKVGYEKEKVKIKRILKGRIDFIEKKIGKEIKDVQDLLK